jgi:hypothetical protein
MDAASTNIALPMSLVLFAVFPRSDIELFDSKGHVLLHGAQYIGLRQRLEDAVARAIKVGGACNKNSHGVLEVTFTPLGLAHYTTTCADSSYFYKPLLHKMEYWDSTDWQVWHFLTELPLQASDMQGNLLIATRWLDIM